MSGEDGSSGVRDTTCCFMSSHYPEVTAGLTSRSQPFNCCSIYLVFFKWQNPLSVQRFTGDASYKKGGCVHWVFFAHKRKEKLLYHKCVWNLWWRCHQRIESISSDVYKLGAQTVTCQFWKQQEGPFTQIVSTASGCDTQLMEVIKVLKLLLLRAAT